MAIPSTEEQETLIYQVRLMIADTPTSPFYPLFQDEEVAQFLSMNGWRLRPAIRMAAIAASMQFAQYTYRERSGDIEVWNNISIQYQKALQNLISESGTAALPDGMMPYFGGISWATVNEINSNTDNVRSPLTWTSQVKQQAKNTIYIQTDSLGNAVGTWIDTNNWIDSNTWGG
jgi:hypothetical protein